MSQDHRPDWKLPLGALVCALLWGSSFPGLKYAFSLIDSHSFSMRLVFAGIRFTLAGLVLLAFVKDLRGEYQRAPKSQLWAVAILQIALNYFLFYWGISMTSGVVTAILNATGSFWWVLLAPVFNGTPWLRGSQWLMLILGFAGVCTAVSGGDAQGVSLFGCVLILLATISATFATLTVRSLSQVVGTLFITGFGLAGGGLISLVAGAPALGAFLASADWRVWLMTLWLATVSALAFSLWYHLVSLYDATALSAYRYLIPICGVIESALFLANERLGWASATGGLMVMVSVYMLSRSTRPPALGRVATTG